MNHFFNFDFSSVYYRKNPEAILNAFAQSFKQDEKAKIILKTLNGDKHSANFLKFQQKIEELNLVEKVILINKEMERNDLMNLMNAADCYISLHRSEGLGLGMMEAMSMGKPVIATAFGGNVDFMNNDNSLLVNFKLTEVPEGCEPYQQGWLWAEPDIMMAAGYMRKLFDDRDFAKETGEKARVYIESNYNPAVFYNAITNWIKD